MKEYVIRRIVQGAIVVIIVTLLVFFVMRFLPGDPILMFITRDDAGKASAERIAALRHEFGLDRSVVVQYIDWVSGVARGNLGTSMVYRTGVMGMVAKSLPITIHLGALAFLLGIIVGIPVGVISAVRRGGWLDTTMTVFANLGITVPIFWLGVLMIYVFGLNLRLLPIFGYTSPLDDFWLSTRQSVMPVICLSVFGIASAARQTRSSMLEVIRQDYIRTAWSKGLNERTVILRHALKNGLIPIVTLKGMTIRNIFGGSVLVESVFNVPGMGRLAVDAILAQDYAIVQGVILVVAVVVVVANIVVDLSYGWLDPRIRYG
ncbi:MAG: ABC transporter permease [Chloroflexi bacterium]|nr:ABC transporter permease [Chloroflexota bacterium]